MKINFDKFYNHPKLQNEPEELREVHAIRKGLEEQKQILGNEKYQEISDMEFRKFVTTRRMTTNK
jgi:hypothetical protein